MEAYFQMVESLMTTLASLNSPVSDDDMVYYVIDGLPEMYNQVCGYMHYQDTFPDFKTVCSLLTSEEMRLKSKSLVTPVDSSSSSPMELLADSGTSRHPSNLQIKSWRPWFNFAKGTCRFGSECRYVHDENAKHSLPKSYRDAFNDPNWQNVMCDEYHALIKNNTWTLVPRPTDTNVVRCMWLFRHKYHANGTLSRYKARLVANGSIQIEGIDVDETFSPVVKPSTIRTVLSLATSRHWSIHQLDVKSAFLHGDLSETRIDTAYLLLYVDDIVLTASSEHLLQQLIHSLHQEFSMIDLGSLNYFLGISVTHDSSGIFLSQRKYVYLTFTRPDISYAVQQVCLYMHDPREPYFSALKQIMRYVSGTLDYGLQLFSSFTTDLVTYSDANWAGCPTARRSTSGYCVFLGNNLLSWSSKRQPILSRSNAGVEYRGVANAVAGLVGYAIYCMSCILHSLSLCLFIMKTSVLFIYPAIRFNIREPNTLRLKCVLFYDPNG
ncbi:ribonuclease H-like domain-containing protein [Tanacetum coccineum]